MVVFNPLSQSIDWRARSMSAAALATRSSAEARRRNPSSLTLTDHCTAERGPRGPRRGLTARRGLRRRPDRFWTIWVEMRRRAASFFMNLDLAGTTEQRRGITGRRRLPSVLLGAWSSGGRMAGRLELRQSQRPPRRTLALGSVDDISECRVAQTSPASPKSCAALARTFSTAALL